MKSKRFPSRCARFLGAMLMAASMAAPAVNAAGPATVNLGTAANFAALAKTGISATGTTSIVGDIGISPAAASYITGFGLIMDVSNTFSTSPLVTGKVYAADYADPTPAYLTTAISDMETAYIDAAGRTLPDFTELGAGDISGMTLVPGLYKWGTGLLIDNTGVTISGAADDVWIFQIAGTLTVNSGAIVTLSDGAQAKNIFWQVAGQTTLGSTSQFKGNILDQTAIVMNTGSTLDGRALAQTAVTLDANTVTMPAATETTPPTVSSTDPANDDTEVPINQQVAATFSEAMDPATITTATFTLVGPDAAPVSGTVSCAGNTATFTPAADLAGNTEFTATVTSGAKDLAGNALASDYVWKFTTRTQTAVEYESAPTDFSLLQNFPNPFNSSTTIQYSLAHVGMVSLKVYNVVGQEVATLVNSHQDAGSYTMTFNANGLSNGVYFYRLEAGSFVSMKKFVFMK